jgi:hypothetical protein
MCQCHCADEDERVIKYVHHVCPSDCPSRNIGYPVPKQEKICRMRAPALPPSLNASLFLSRIEVEGRRYECEREREQAAQFEATLKSSPGSNRPRTIYPLSHSPQLLTGTTNTTHRGTKGQERTNGGGGGYGWKRRGIGVQAAVGRIGDAGVSYRIALSSGGFA